MNHEQIFGILQAKHKHATHKAWLHACASGDKIIVNSDGLVLESLQSKTCIAPLCHDNIDILIAELSRRNLWNIPKDKIDVCNHCEFRYMCSDMCKIIERTDGTFYRSKECEYNPFIALWTFQDGYMPLATCNIICDSEKFQINHFEQPNENI